MNSLATPKEAPGARQGWIHTTVGAECDVMAGFGFPERLQGKLSGDLPFYKVGDISEAWKGGSTFLTESRNYVTHAECRELRAKPLPANATVFAKIGAAIALNRRAMLSEPSLVDNNVMGLFPRSDALDPKFLFHFACTLRLDELSRATTVPSVRKSDIEAIALPRPPIDEQKRIVTEIEKQLTRLDAGVTALRRVQANLKRYRAAVLKAACEGRLVPTEAELVRKEGRVYEPGQVLLDRILEARRQRHLDAQAVAVRRKKYVEPSAAVAPVTGQLPEGWAWATWGQIGASQNGRPFPSAQYQDHGCRLLRPGNLHVSGRVVWTPGNTRYMPERFTEENPDLIVSGGELVMNLTAQSLKDEFLGRVCLTDSDETCLLNQRLARLTPIIVLPEFALVLLKAERFRRFVDGLNSGSLIQHMFTSQLAEFTFPLPPLAEQVRIVAEVERRLSVIEELEGTAANNLQRATRLRQSVLREAFR